MKKVLFFIGVVLIAACFMLPVKASSDYYKDIIVTFNHDGCDNQVGKEVVIQLFENGKKVEGQEVILNEENNYTHTFSQLQIFKPESPDEIRYEVKTLEDGVYKLISEKSVTHEKEHIQKWVQILPEDIAPGHTYVITTDNWNYENNGFSKIIYLRGDITAKGAAVLPEYNIVNGKQSYYIIDGEPIENTKWTVSAVPEGDPDYDVFKDYLMFTNEEGKKLTLTGYNQNGTINWIFKRSGKNGYIESEDAMYTNKVTLTYVEGSKGRFYIGTKNLYPEPNNIMQYITLSGQNQYQAGSEMARAAQFKAYEYVDLEVEKGVTVYVEDTICEKDTVVINKYSEYKKSIDVNFDCTGCEGKKDKGVTIQLFADGLKVEDGEITLNNENGFTYTFEDLPVFYDESTQKINYELKAKIDGKYYKLPEKDITYQKENISKWIQVNPANITPGKTYIITTENLNYESNGFSRYVYLRGDVTAKGAAVLKEFNTIDGIKTYYSLDGEPIENTLWVVSSVPADDPNYNEFSDYLMLTNEEGKKLTLTGYNQNGTINFIYKRSGKDGWIESENAMYTNKVQIIPTAGSKALFHIGTKNLYPEPNNMMQYLRLSSQNQYQATANLEEAQNFMAYEYVDKEIVVATKVLVSSSLCEVLTLPNIVNPETGNLKLIIIGLIAIGIVLIVLRSTKRKAGTE